MMSRTNIVFVLSSALSTLLISLSTYATEIDNKQTELKQVSSKIQVLKQSLNEDQTQESRSQEQLNKLEVELSNLTQKIQALNQKLLSEQTEINTLNQEKEQHQNALAQHRAMLSQQIRMFYQLGQMQSLKTILNPDNLNNINRHLYYYRYLNDQRLQLVNEIKQSIIAINDNVKIATQHENTLKLLLRQKQGQLKKQLSLKESRQNLLIQQQRQTLDKQEQLQRLTADQNNLQNILSHLHAQEIKNPSITFSQLHGKLLWPIKGKIQNTTNDELENNQRMPGIVIIAPEETPVHAISSGKVIFANWLRGFGFLVIINHGQGYMSLYGRNQTLFAKVGDFVKARTVIASSGNSGGFNQAGLYFEIRQNGTPVDPHLWCKT